MTLRLIEAHESIPTSRGAEKNGTNTNRALGSAHLYSNLRPRGSERWRSRGQRLRTTRPADCRGRISAESLLHGERLAHGGLRFRMGRLGTCLVNRAATDCKVGPRMQL